MALNRSTSRSSNHPTNMTRCGKCCYYCRQVTTFLFSHIGLCTLLLGYALVGAFTFQALESENEHQQRLDMIRTRTEMILALSNMTNQSAILHYETWTKNARKILEDFELTFLHAVKYKGYDGNDEPAKSSSQWSFSGALLYSIIVITTIGYGNVAPRTDWGKIVTILYAIIGIPLMLFCLSNIGHTMAHSFKFIYWKCCCYLCVKPKKVQRRQRRRRRMIRQQRQRALIASAIQSQPGSSYPIEQNSLHALTTPLTPITPGLHPPTLTRTLSTRSTLSPATILANTNNNFLEPSSPYTPICTTPSSAGLASLQRSPLFFGSNNKSQTSANTDQQQQHSNTNSNNLQPPRKSNLARSLSARYHNEIRLPIHSDANRSRFVTSLTNKDNKNGKDKISLSSIICNKYASWSDECIDAYRNVSNDNPVLGSIQLKLPPRRVPSQVRFQTNDQPNQPSQQVQQQETSLNGTHQTNVPPPPFSYACPSNDSYNFTPGDQIPPPPFQSYYENCTNNNVGQASQHDPLLSYQLMLLNKNNELSSSHELRHESDDDSDDSDIQEKNIPITVCLALVIGYICGGAWFFSTSEEWSFLDASYFCFVTLSTIGFGDLVPGRTVLSTPEDGQMTLAICALYLLFGMALLAMSLNLVKEKVTETVRIIGERIGILVNDDDDLFY